MVLGESHPFGVGLTAGGQKVRFITANVIEGVMHPCSNANHASLGNFLLLFTFTVQILYL